MVKRTSGEVEPPYYEIFGSPIHGQGARAARPVPEGTYIIEYTGERISKEESERRGLERMAEAETDGGGAVYIFELDEDWDLDGNQPGNDARLFNHSCDPNCETENDEGRIWVIALRDIEPGEELTFDYGYGIETFLDHPCVCGSDNCIGYIVGAAYRKKLKRKLAGKLGSKKKRKEGKDKAKPKEKEKEKGKGKAKGKGSGKAKGEGGGAGPRRRERVA